MEHNPFHDHIHGIRVLQFDRLTPAAMLTVSINNMLTIMLTVSITISIAIKKINFSKLLTQFSDIVDDEKEFMTSQNDTATRNSIVVKFKGNLEVTLTPLLLEGLQK